METVNVLWGGAALHGQVFPSTDANDASEEEPEAASWTRGERGPSLVSASATSTWMEKKKKRHSNWAKNLDKTFLKGLVILLRVYFTLHHVFFFYKDVK